MQHHPRPGGTWAYDAVNEVYFDDPRDLDERVAWFARHPPAAAGPLFRSPRFLVVTEASVPV